MKMLLSIVALFGLIGCSSTIHKRFSMDRPSATSISLDAKQRLVVVTDGGGEVGTRRVLCAEPSPDALVGIAASGALEAVIASKGSGKLAGSLAEAVGELGERTPTIQLLRDGLYRACEAYMNGVVGKVEYRQILSGYDDLVVTLLAIEGLTQRPRSPATMLQPQSEVEITETIKSTSEEEAAAAEGGAAAAEGGAAAGAEEPTPPEGEQTAKVTTKIITSGSGGENASGDQNMAQPEQRVSKEVAEVVKEILIKYYELQTKVYGAQYLGKSLSGDRREDDKWRQ